MVYTVVIPQLKELQQAFAKAPQAVATQVKQAGNKALVRYQATAKQETPVDKGTLRGSLQVTPMSQRDNVIEGSMGTGLFYAPFMEEGTGIYGPAKSPIRPKRAKVLAFNVGGRTVFARQVKGAKPHWYMRTSLRQNQSATEGDFAQALENVANEIARASS